jgi:hypothetical protein
VLSSPVRAARSRWLAFGAVLMIAFSLPRRAREQASPVGAEELATDQTAELSAAA